MAALDSFKRCFELLLYNQDKEKNMVPIQLGHRVHLKVEYGHVVLDLLKYGTKLGHICGSKKGEQGHL